MTPPPLLILGNANIDMVLGEVDGWPEIGTEIEVGRFEKRPGGSAGNTALALSGLGVPHLYVGNTGSDEAGRWLQTRFDTRYTHWQERGEETTLTIGIVHKGGNRAFFTTPGHLKKQDPLLDLENVPDAPRGSAIALISGSFLLPKYIEHMEPLFQTLKDRGWARAVDPGWPPEGWCRTSRDHLNLCFEHSDYLLLNDDELTGFTGLPLPDAFETIRVRLKADQCLVVKQGEQGAGALQNGNLVSIASPDVQVIDTVGAGDTFNAAFLAARQRGADLTKALEAGTRTAARAISTFPRIYQA